MSAELPVYGPTRGHQRAAQAWRDGNTRQWITAFYAARIVGQRQVGATLSLAHDIARSADTVERLAKAHIAYRYLFKILPDATCRNNLRQARRRLSYLHFSAAFRALKAEVDPLEVFAELTTAAENGAGVRVLSAALDGRIVSAGLGREHSETDLTLGRGEYLLPCYDADSDLFRQAMATGQYRAVLVPVSAEQVVVRY